MVYDLLMVGVMAFMAFRGSAKGIAWQIAAIACIVLCFLFSTPLSYFVAPYIKVNPPLNRWLSMLVIYLGISFVCFSVAHMFRSAMERAKFEEYDKHLGAVFGLVKGAALCFVLTFFMICLSEDAATYVLNSHTGFATAVLMERIKPVLPAEIEKILQPGIDKLDHSGIDYAHSPLFNELGPQEEEPAPANDPRNRPGNWSRNHNTTRRRGSSSDFRGSGLPAEENEQGNNSTPDTKTDPGQGSIFSHLVQAFPNFFGEALQEHAATHAEYHSPGVTAPGFHSRSRPAQIPDPIPNPEEFQEPMTPKNQVSVIPPGLRMNLSKRVSELIADNPVAQEKKLEAIQQLLAQESDRVAVAVLQDWLADLEGKGTDPDPKTDLTTPLETRLERQRAALEK